MQEFIPVTDEMLERDPALWEQLVPFHVDRPCRHLEAQPLALTPVDLQSDIPGGDRRDTGGTAS